MLKLIHIVMMEMSMFCSRNDSLHADEEAENHTDIPPYKHFDSLSDYNASLIALTKYILKPFFENDVDLPLPT